MNSILMNILKFIAFILVLVSNPTLCAQAFVKVDGQARDIAISSKDKGVYIINTSGNVERYLRKTTNYRSHGELSKNAKSITVDPNGTVFMVSTSNDLHIDIKGRWNKIPGMKVTEVDINRKGSIRVLNTSGRIFYYYDGTWNPHSKANRSTSGFNQFVTTPSSKEMYARFKDNTFTHFKGGTWQTLSGKPLRIAIDNANGNVYAVGRNRGIYKWNTSSKKWELLKNTRKDFKEVAVYDSDIWAISMNGSVYKYDKNKPPLDVPGTYKVTITNLGSPKKGKKYYGTMGVYLNAKFDNYVAEIPPLDNLKNRFWDTPLSSALPANGGGYRAKGVLNSIDNSITSEASLEINKVREFKIVSDLAYGNPTFDFQFNVKQGRLDLPGMRDIGQWERIKIPLEEVSFGKEYHYSHLTSGTVISFKIEKL